MNNEFLEPHAAFSYKYECTSFVTLLKNQRTKSTSRKIFNKDFDLLSWIVAEQCLFLKDRRIERLTEWRSDWITE